jgi:putative serine protease PepD
MTTTYDPFIPADGTDQRRYDEQRRAEGGSAWAGEPRWEPEPRWDQQPQWQPAPRHEPEPASHYVPEQRYETSDQRYETPGHRAEPGGWQAEPSWDAGRRHTGEQPAWHAGLDSSPLPAAAGIEPQRPARADRLGRAKPVLAALVAVLIGVAAWQAYRIEAMNSDNASLHTVLATEKVRTDRLEKELAGVFDPEAVSSRVLPSVFRVRAGEFTGTAFSVGQKAKDGEANLLTNYHVVAELYTGGGRAVTLERGTTKINATIVKVNKGKDLALLHADQDIAGLATAAAQVKPGQQVVVVGAPLGLDDTVTTGVISAYRPSDPDGPTIQFDAPINPGNSGGPVVNSSNQVVGLATAKAKDAEGIGLAIPIKTACSAFAVC